MNSFEKILAFIRARFNNQEVIPLHAPVFAGNERAYVLDAIDSTFVSSVGEYVNRFEKMMAATTGAGYAVAIVNGTSALHMGLIVSGVRPGDDVISQALTFIATANAISYIGANAVFVDVDAHNLGMSPKALKAFLEEFAEIKEDGFAYNKRSGNRLGACVPMHTFGIPCEIEEIVSICDTWNIPLVEDAAESIGSYYKGKHTGTFGKVGVFSFNGNKTITCGGGGAIVTNDETIARHAKHLTTQAKVPHRWDFVHDEIGYNYRMPNLNAAMACAQLEQLPAFLKSKRKLALEYKEFLSTIEGISFIKEPEHTEANYWLNAILVENREQRDHFLQFMNDHGVMARPVWTLMNELSMFAHCQHDGLQNSKWIADRLINIPSSVIDYGN